MASWTDPREVAALRSQISSARVVVGSPVTAMRFEAAEAPVSGRTGFLPALAQALDDRGDEVGRISLWLDDGRLTELHYWSWLDAEPTALPDPARLRLVLEEPPNG